MLELSIFLFSVLSKYKSESKNFEMSKIKRRKEMSSSDGNISDDSDSSYDSPVFNNKLHVSSWRREDLVELGIHYSLEPISVSEFYQMLKNECTRVVLPDEAKPFITYTKEQLKFSLDLETVCMCEDNDSVEAYNRERDLVTYLDGSIKELNKFNMTVKLMNESLLHKVLFTKWMAATQNFVEVIQDLIRLLIYPAPMAWSTSSNKTQKKEPQRVFTHAFSRFSEIFFLLPQWDEKKTMMIRNKHFTSVPHIRYYEQTNRGVIGQPLLITLIEAKTGATKSPSDEPNKSWIAERFMSPILGHIGAELFLQSKYSAFAPNVLGIVCTKSEMMFVYLEIKRDHAEDIHQNRKTEGKQALIHYTKAYDYLKADERNELLELMFWIGCVQKQNLHRHYLKQ